MPVTLPGIRVECYQSQCQVSGWNYYGIVSLEMVAFEHTHTHTHTQKDSNLAGQLSVLTNTAVS